MLKDFLSVSLHPDMREDRPYNALRVNHECASHHSQEAASVQLPFLPDTVELGNVPIGVTDQQEWQPMSLFETLMRADAIGADTNDDGSILREAPGGIPECTGFSGTAWGVVLRVEVQHHPPSPKLGETEGTPLVIERLKVWRRHPNMHHSGSER